LNASADRARLVELLRDARLHQVLALREPTGWICSRMIRGILRENEERRAAEGGCARGIAHDPPSPTNLKTGPHRSTSWTTFVGLSEL
jgi:hypothetical protein